MNQRDPYLEELLSAYLDGQTTGDETARVESLLAEQDEYRQLLSEMRSLGAEIRWLPRHHLGDQFACEVLEQAGSKSQGPAAARAAAVTTGDRATEAVKTAVKTARWPRWGLMAAAVAATVILAVGTVHQLVVPEAADSPPRLADSNGSEMRPLTTESPLDLPPPNQPPDAGQPDTQPDLAEKTVDQQPHVPWDTAADSGSGRFQPSEDVAEASRMGTRERRSVPANMATDPLRQSSDAWGTDPGKAADEPGAYQIPGGLLLVIDVQLTPRGRQQDSFRQALQDHGFDVPSSIRANSKLEASLLSSRFVNAARPADKPPALGHQSELPHPELFYVIAAVGQVDHFWRSMSERTDRFADVSLDAAIKPTELAMFRRLNQAAEQQWKAKTRHQPMGPMAAFRLILSSLPERLAARQTAEDAAEPVRQQPARETRASKAEPGADQVVPAEPMSRWLDENMRAEVLFVVQ